MDTDAPKFFITLKQRVKRLIIDVNLARMVYRLILARNAEIRNAITHQVPMVNWRNLVRAVNSPLARLRVIMRDHAINAPLVSRN